MRGARVALLFTLVVATACAQTPLPAPEPPAPTLPPTLPPAPTPPPDAPTVPRKGPPPVPAPSREIVVLPLEKNGLFGVRATYHIEATLAEASEVLFDFDQHASFRPGMLESTIVFSEGNSALVRFVVPGLLGINPEIICQNDVVEKPGQVRIDFRRESGSAMIQELFGSFDIREGPRDGWLTVVQEFYVAALMVDREEIPRQHAEDAAAVRQRIEAVHRGSGNVR